MTNRLEINWKLDGFVDEQRYYCSETPIDISAPPSPKKTLLSTDRSYTDTLIETNKTYYICLSSVRNNIEKFSNIVKKYTIDSSLFKASSPFTENLIDKVGLIWTANGDAKIQNSALSLDGQGDYLTTTASDSLHFANSEDVTIRFKVKIRAFNASNIATIFSTWNPTDSSGYSIRLTNTGFQLVVWSVSLIINITYQIMLNTEIEVSIERKSMNWFFYVNGTQVGVSTNQSANYKKTNPQRFYLGSGTFEGYGSARDLNGTIRYFQIIKGKAIGDGGNTTQLIDV